MPKKDISPSERPSDPEQQIRALEEQLAFQQHTVDHLEEIVRSQQTEVEKLKNQLAQLRLMVEQLSRGELGKDLPHEKPPHY